MVASFSVVLLKHLNRLKLVNRNTKHEEAEEEVGRAEAAEKDGRKQKKQAEDGHACAFVRLKLNLFYRYNLQITRCSR